MKLTFLGTSSMIPTKDRNPSSILLTDKNENILIDCGEGTQRQLRKIGVSPTKITKILITHWHGDHILGLPGLIQTIAAAEYDKTLEIFGPKGTKKFMKQMIELFLSKRSLKLKLKIHEIKESKNFYETEDYYLASKNLKHTMPVIGYSFIQKDKRNINIDYTKKFGLVKDPILKKLKDGKTISYKGNKISPKDATILKKGKKVSIITDTEYFKDISKFVKNSDLLICESTFEKSLKEKAKEYKHMTSEDAAKIAKEANVKKLFLTHFGQRYKTTTNLEKEAKKIFPNTKAAKDFLEIKKL